MIGITGVDYSVITSHADLIFISYPNVSDAVALGGASVCKALASLGVLRAVRIGGNVTVSDGGYSSVTAWQNFKKSTISFIEGYCLNHSDAIKISKQLGESIVEQCYNRFPRWPSNDSQSSCTFPICETLCATDCINEYFALAVGRVFFTIKNTRSGFSASIDGTVDIKVIGITRLSLRTIENKLKSDNGVKKFVEQCEKNFPV